MIKFIPGLLKKARRNCHLTTREVGAILKKDRTTIWRWETGQSDLSVSILCELMTLYRISPMEIFVKTQEGL